MAQTLASGEKILVLILGGTINADWRKTKKIDENTNKPKTTVKPYRDKKGRLPVQIYIEDILKLGNVDFLEISDKDSKELTTEELQRATDAIHTARHDGYTKVLYVIGTDMAIPAARMLEYACLPHTSIPVIFVTAMEEMTRDMDLRTQKFVSAATDGIKHITNALTALLKPGVYLWADNINDFADPLCIEKDFISKKFIVKTAFKP